MRCGWILPVVLLVGACAGVPRALEEGPAAVVDTTASSRGFRRVPIGLCEDYPEESTSIDRVRDDMRVLRALGVRTLRVSLPWDSIEPADDRFDWSFWDRFVAIAIEHGIRLIPYVAYTPAWAAREGAAEPWHEPPREVAEFEEFVRVLASRYGDRIDSWELWNEPDNPAYWSGSAAAYAELVRAGARAVRRSDPTALIVLGGIAWNTDLVQELFDDYDIARDVDVVNVHSYAETWSGDRLESIPAYVDRVARILERHGGHEQIWAAEVGYSSLRRGNRISADYTARFDYEHTAAFQAVALVRMLVLLRATDEVDLVAWYELRDLARGADAIGDDNNRHLGVVRPDGVPKPAYAALAQAVRLLDGPLRVVDADVAATSVSDATAAFELHAFERPDGSLLVFAWIPTLEAGAVASSASHGADRREADLLVRLPTRAAEASIHDEAGRRRTRVALRVDGDRRVLPLHVRAGDVAIAVIGERVDGGGRD